MHAADAFGLLYPGGDRGDRKGGGVGGENRVRAAQLGQGGQQARFSARSSGAASTTISQSARSSALRPREAARPPPVPPRRSSDLARSSDQGFAELRGAGGQSDWIRVVEVGLEPAHACQLGDPGAHRPGPRDADPADAHAAA